MISHIKKAMNFHIANKSNYLLMIKKNMHQKFNTGII